MATFRKVNFEISKGNGYGQYFISGTYKGKAITAHTTDSEAYDYLNDADNKVKQLEARKHCYMKIIQAYNNL